MGRGKLRHEPPSPPNWAGQPSPTIGPARLAPAVVAALANRDIETNGNEYRDEERDVDKDGDGDGSRDVDVDVDRDRLIDKD